VCEAAQLLKRIETAVDSCDTNIPLFNDTGVRHCRLHLSYMDSYTFQWLQMAIANITLPSTDHTMETLQLQLVTPA